MQPGRTGEALIHFPQSRKVVGKIVEENFSYTRIF